MPRADRQIDGVADVQHSSVLALAAAVGRHRSILHEWFKQGCPSSKPYSEVLVRRWAASAGYEDLKAPSDEVAALLGAIQTRAATGGPLDRNREANTKLTEIQVARELRQLVTAADVEQLLEQLSTSWLEILLDVPDQAAAAIARSRPELVAGELRAAIEQQLVAARARMTAAVPRILRTMLAAAPPAAEGTGGQA